jgi:hypothetical protein
MKLFARAQMQNKTKGENSCIYYARLYCNRTIVFEAEYNVTTNPVVSERVIIKHTSITTVAQSEVCTETTGLGLERYHVALQSGIASQPDK